MKDVYVNGTGIWVPPFKVTNDELVKSYNSYVDKFNSENQDAINSGEIESLTHSSSEFIEGASGIQSRYVIEKDHLLDPNYMHPVIPHRSSEELSFSAEVSVLAAQDAMKNAGITPEDIDAVIVSCANIQRAYPAISIEVQNALGIDGYAYDMMMACSSTTFGISNAYADIISGKAETVIVINPEITTAHNNYKSRETHFIFGDVCTAIVVSAKPSDESYKIISNKLITQFSNNLRNDFGFMNTIEDHEYQEAALRVNQNGRKVFKEVSPMVAEIIQNHLLENKLTPQDIKQFFLHQANIKMNEFIILKLLGKEADSKKAPNVIQDFANTASAGSIISFHYHRDLDAQEKALICSFGGGYSVGSIILEKC